MSNVDNNNFIILSFCHWVLAVSRQKYEYKLSGITLYFFPLEKNKLNPLNAQLQRPSFVCVRVCV